MAIYEQSKLFCFGARDLHYMLGRADNWLMSEYRINGQIKVREVPFASEAEWRHWWLGEFKIIKGVNTMVRLPRMSDRENYDYLLSYV